MFNLVDALHGVDGTFRYERCRTCHSVFQSPRVTTDDLGRCYPADYFTHEQSERRASIAEPGTFKHRVREAVLQQADGHPDGSEGMFRMVGRVGAMIPMVRRRARFGLIDSLAFTGQMGDRCLEVGFGQASELRQLAQLGWTACGIDVDPTAVALARRYDGINVEIGTLVDNEFPDGHFALIYLHHSLEHLPNLEECLARARCLLRPGGKFVAVYPNPRSLGTLVYRGNSANWDPPRHLVLPARKALGDLLMAAGFHSVSSWTRALRAAPYSRVARHYRRHPEGGAGLPESSPASVDYLFASVEAALVGLRMQLGEEIVVSARV
jgi:SAM-dependent methyltransferase